MTKRLIRLIEHDFRMQWRYRIIAAYIVVIGVTAGALYYLAEYLTGWFFGLTVFSDYAALGFFFLGGLMLFEKAEGTHSSLAISPVSAGEYLAAKTITLTLISLVAAVVLGLASRKDVHWVLYLFTVALISIQYIGLGAVMGHRCKTVTGYIIGSVWLFLPVVLPCVLAFLDPMPVGFALIPAAAQLKLIFISFSDNTVTPAWQIGMMLTITALAAVAGAWLGRRTLRQAYGNKQ